MYPLQIMFLEDVTLFEDECDDTIPQGTVYNFLLEHNGTYTNSGAIETCSVLKVTYERLQQLYHSKIITPTVPYEFVVIKPFTFWEERTNGEYAPWKSEKGFVFTCYLERLLGTKPKMIPYVFKTTGQVVVVKYTTLMEARLRQDFIGW